MNSTRKNNARKNNARKNKTRKNSTRKNKTRKNKSRKNITEFLFSDNLDKLFISSCLKCKQPDKIYINNPVLMTDNKLIDKIYSQPRKTMFDGVHAILDNTKYPKIFGSNIDTIFFCHVLKQNRSKFGRIKSFFELGIGGGFISKYILSKFNIKKAYLNDIEKQSIDYAVSDLNLPKILNSELKTTTIQKPFNCKITEKNGITFFQGDGINTLKFLIPERLDLLVCNPPYIPSSKKEYDLDINSPNFWEGTRLLRYLLQNYSKYANHLLMIVSSLSLVNEYVVKELSNVKFKVLENHTVPIKVYNNGKNILDNKKIMGLLSSDKKQININNYTFNVGIVNNHGNDDWKYNHTIYFVYLYM
jgi:methylase of polypeptide subunit release factors